MNQRKRIALPELDKFAVMCETIRFVFPKDDSFFHFIEREKKRQELFKIAQAGGIQYMQVFISNTSHDVHNATVTSNAAGYREGWLNASKKYTPYLKTGDEEFDKFRETLINYDHYWHYSDDPGVSSRGIENDRFIDACVKKGGMYKTFHDLWKEQNKK